MSKILRKDGLFMRRAGKLIVRQPVFCWEGVMTVGQSGSSIGWDSGQYGSMTNTPVETCLGNFLTAILWTDDFGPGILSIAGTGSNSVNALEIDGEVYNMNGNASISGPSNPFPAVGQTCLIRILT